MSSSGGGIGSTLTSGIQNIAAILPLLGTEQCSVQVSSALTRGYLYAAATPMSIFGSIGVVTAGFKTLVACFSFGNIEGAKILGDMGFEPQGENLSLIMVKAGKGKNTERYIIETRMDELIKELNIDKSRITGVSHRSAAWNVKMVATTALLCTFSIAPYIYLNLGANSLKKSTTWVFPGLRATGGFITATLIQLLIQRRITTLSNEYLEYLVNRDQLPGPNSDVEAAVKHGDTKKHRLDACTWLLLCLLLIGILASVVGYVGCFSVVQNSTSTFGPVSWLCLEAGLSLMRLAIWAWNPTSDDAPPLEITLELDKHNPLPTCNKDNNEILRYKVLPLTRARDFLKTITSFAGLIEPFSNPDLSLYYTMTRKRRLAYEDSLLSDTSEDIQSVLVFADIQSVSMDELSVSVDIQSASVDRERVSVDIEDHHRDLYQDELGGRTLYITVFDHKERTTRVYTRDNETDTVYSTKSDAPLVDVGHLLLEVEIDTEIDPKGDPISSDSNILDSLRKHHRSILEHIQYRLGTTDVTKSYTIENSWTMKAEDTISTLQRLREENGDDWKTVVENGKKEERNEQSLLICDYFTYASIERERRLLDEKRVKWIARRMDMIAKETKGRFHDERGVEYRVNKQAAERMPAAISPEDTEQMLFRQQFLMELLLAYEAKGWEQLFWNKFKAFLDKIGNDRLTREWRANCWKRLNPQMHAAQKRLVDFDTTLYKDSFLEYFNDGWAFINHLFEWVEIPNPTSLSELREEIEDHNRTHLVPLNDETRLQVENEIEDIEFRLKRGSKLGRFDQFWDDDTLFECRYSRSKWLYLGLLGPPLEIYLHALKQNRNIIHITFTGSYAISDYDINRLLANLPWVTSISRDSSERPPAINRDFLFIKSTNNDLITFAKEIRHKLDPFSTYIFTDPGFDIYSLSGGLGGGAGVLVLFVAPISGESLILRLIHSGEPDGPLEVTLGSTKIQLNPSSESSPTIDDLTLYPIPGPSESDHLLFEPGIRNDIIIQFRGTVDGKRHNHILHDIDLLDEAGGLWRKREI